MRVNYFNDGPTYSVIPQALNLADHLSFYQYNWKSQIYTEVPWSWKLIQFKLEKERNDEQNLMKNEATSFPHNFIWKFGRRHETLRIKKRELLYKNKTLDRNSLSIFYDWDHDFIYLYFNFPRHSIELSLLKASAVSFIEIRSLLDIYWRSLVVIYFFQLDLFLIVK